MAEAVRPRMRDGKSWYVDYPNGDVELVVLRRVEASMGHWNEVRHRRPSQAEAESAYDAYCARGAEESQRRAARRLRWGPAGVSRPR